VFEKLSYKCYIESVVIKGAFKMTTDGKEKQYAILSCSILLTLVLGSLVVRFNIIDFIYLIILIFYIIRYFHIKE